MILGERLARGAGWLALWLGYGAGLARRAFDGIRQQVDPRRHWRMVRVGGLAVLVPPGWGDLETALDGGFVIYDRPRRFRVEGDAAWYSSAVELRIRRPGAEGLPRLAPMTETCRSIETPEGPLLLALRIANGVGSSKRREARDVLASARAVRTGDPLLWPESMNASRYSAVTQGKEATWLKEGRTEDHEVG